MDRDPTLVSVDVLGSGFGFVHGRSPFAFSRIRRWLSVNSLKFSRWKRGGAALRLEFAPGMACDPAALLGGHLVPGNPCVSVLCAISVVEASPSMVKMSSVGHVVAQVVSGSGERLVLAILGRRHAECQQRTF